MYNYTSRYDGLDHLRDLDLRQVNELGGTRVVLGCGTSKVRPICDKEFLDSHDIYSQAKSKGIKDTLVWEEKEVEFPEYEYKYDESKELAKKILSFGGNAVCIPEPEEDFENIMKYGQFWFGKGAKMMKGRPSQCHKNSCNLWEQNKHNTRICTGYALSSDGIWRQHSWLLLFKANTNQIVETTVKRIAYFGFVMDEETCKNFVFNNM